MTPQSRPAAARAVGDRLATDLRAAADVLVRDGWSRDELHAKVGGTAHDITGAIYVATGYHQLVDGSWTAVDPLAGSSGRRATDCMTWMARQVPARYVYDFNDRLCTDVDHAAAVLRAAADDAERLLRNPRDVERLLS